MPEQQSFVLYIVVGSGSKSGSRLPKTAPGAVFKVRLHGSLATGQMKKVNKQCLLDTPRTVRVSEKTWQVIETLVLIRRFK